MPVAVSDLTIARTNKAKDMLEFIQINYPEDYQRFRQLLKDRNISENPADVQFYYLLALLYEKKNQMDTDAPHAEQVNISPEQLKILEEKREMAQKEKMEHVIPRRTQHQLVQTYIKQLKQTVQLNPDEIKQVEASQALFEDMFVSLVNKAEPEKDVKETIKKSIAAAFEQTNPKIYQNKEIEVKKAAELSTDTANLGDSTLQDIYVNTILSGPGNFIQKAEAVTYVQAENNYDLETVRHVANTANTLAQQVDQHQSASHFFINHAKSKTNIVSALADSLYEKLPESRKRDIAEIVTAKAIKNALNQIDTSNQQIWTEVIQSGFLDQVIRRAQQSFNNERGSTGPARIFEDLAGALLTTPPVINSIDIDRQALSFFTFIDHHHKLPADQKIFRLRQNVEGMSLFTLGLPARQMTIPPQILSTVPKNITEEDLLTYSLLYIYIQNVGHEKENSFLLPILSTFQNSVMSDLLLEWGGSPVPQLAMSAATGVVSGSVKTGFFIKILSLFGFAGGPISGALTTAVGLSSKGFLSGIANWILNAGFMPGAGSFIQAFNKFLSNPPDVNRGKPIHKKDWFIAFAAIFLVFLVPILFGPLVSLKLFTESEEMATLIAPAQGGARGIKGGSCGRNYTGPTPPASALPSSCPVNQGSITQCPNGGWSHGGVKAYDFGVGNGSPITTTHGGFVTYINPEIVAGHPFGEKDPASSGCGNQIQITGFDSATGTTFQTIYGHLQGVEASILEKYNKLQKCIQDQSPVCQPASPPDCTCEALTVDANELIGRSDNNGNSTGPHLHYEYRGPNELSIPIGCAGYVGTCTAAY